jgi:alpha/beta superfamily hydrolase
MAYRNSLPEYVETTHFFRSGEEVLFGILSTPRSSSQNEVAVVLIPGGSQGPSSGRNQMTARLARRLAAMGLTTFRFDFHGIGEATGTVDRFRLDRPFVEDTTAALAYLTDHGINRFLLVGGCFGARTALACSRERTDIEGLVLQALPVRDKEKDATGITRVAPDRTVWQYARRGVRPHVVRNMFRRRHRRAYVHLFREAWRSRGSSENVEPSWMSASLVADVADVVARSIPTLIVNGTQDPGYLDFEHALEEELGELFGRPEADVELTTLEGRVGAAADATLHEPVMDVIGRWLARRQLTPSAVPVQSK